LKLRKSCYNNNLAVLLLNSFETGLYRTQPSLTVPSRELKDNCVDLQMVWFYFILVHDNYGEIITLKMKSK
jgi:hypothetical protein